jgi:hypothetical protein
VGGARGKFGERVWWGIKKRFSAGGVVEDGDA